MLNAPFSHVSLFIPRVMLVSSLTSKHFFSPTPSPTSVLTIAEESLEKKHRGTLSGMLKVRKCSKYERIYLGKKLSGEDLRIISVCARVCAYVQNCAAHYCSCALGMASWPFFIGSKEAKAEVKA